MGLLSSPSSFIGVDIGTFGIKVVELAKRDGKIKLLTYGFSEISSNFSNTDWQKDTKYIADKINKICDEAGVENRNAVSALPTFSVFSSIINLPNVGKNEMAEAINWEAKKVMPIPLEEMTVDWRKVKDDSGSGNMKVLLTGAPNNLVKRYVDIFAEAQIGLVSLEPESFSLIRSLLGGDLTSVLLVEIGASTTDITIIDDNIPVFNRSIDVGGMSITSAISRQLGVGLERAEQFKYDMGITSIEMQQNSVPKIIADALAPMINEMKYTTNLYMNKNDKKIEKVILSGGSSLLPGLPAYLEKILNINVFIGDPWARVDCPEDLRSLLGQIGPRMSVAVGLAMRGV